VDSEPTEDTLHGVADPAELGRFSAMWTGLHSPDGAWSHLQRWNWYVLGPV